MKERQRRINEIRSNKTAGIIAHYDLYFTTKHYGEVLGKVNIQQPLRWHEVALKLSGGCFTFRLSRPMRCEFLHVGGGHIEVLLWRNQVRD